MRTAHGFVLVVLLVVAALLVGIGSTVAYFKFSAKTTPTTSPIPSPVYVGDQNTVEKIENETANWKVYTNANFKYSMKLPNTLTKSPSNYGGEGGTLLTDTWNAPDNAYSISVYAYPDIYASTSKPSFNAKITKEDNITISGQSVKKSTGTEIISAKGTLIHVGPIKNNSNYVIIYSSGSNTASPQSLETFDKVISTFKFTK